MLGKSMLEQSLEETTFQLANLKQEEYFSVKGDNCYRLVQTFTLSKIFRLLVEQNRLHYKNKDDRRSKPILTKIREDLLSKFNLES